MSLRPVPARKPAPPGALEAPKAPEARLRELLHIGAARAARTGAHEDVRKWFSEPPPIDGAFPPLERMERLKFIVTKQERGLPPYPDTRPIPDTFWTIDANFPIFTRGYFCENFFKVFSLFGVDTTYVQCLEPDYASSGRTKNIEMPIEWVSEAINMYQRIPGFRNAEVTMVKKKDFWPVWELTLSRTSYDYDRNDPCRAEPKGDVINDLWVASGSIYY